MTVAIMQLYFSPYIGCWQVSVSGGKFKRIQGNL